MPVETDLCVSCMRSPAHHPSRRKGVDVDSLSLDLGSIPPPAQQQSTGLPKPRDPSMTDPQVPSQPADASPDSGKKGLPPLPTTRDSVFRSSRLNSEPDIAVPPESGDSLELDLPPSKPRRDGFSSAAARAGQHLGERQR